MSARGRQLVFPFATIHGGIAWGSRKEFVARMPAGQSLVVPVSEAKVIYATARRLGRRASVQRIARGSLARLVTIWGAAA